MSKQAEIARDYTAYAQLVSSLLPRAVGVTLFEPSGDVRWTSLPSIEPSLPQLVKRTLAEDSSGDGARVQVGGDEPAYLWVAEDNPRAHRFYTRNGFALDGATHTEPFLGETLTEVRFVR